MFFPLLKSFFLVGNPCITIVSCYSSTNGSDETDITTFYNELSSLVWYITKHKTLIISGGLNAQIGKDWNNKFSLLKWREKRIKKFFVEGVKNQIQRLLSRLLFPFPLLLLFLSALPSPPSSCKASIKPRKPHFLLYKPGIHARVGGAEIYKHDSTLANRRHSFI